MIYAVDAHALLWYFANSPRLSAAADAILSNPASNLVPPATAYAEACWIVEHGRIPGLSVADIQAALDADPRFTIYLKSRKAPRFIDGGYKAPCLSEGMTFQPFKA